MASILTYYIILVVSLSLVVFIVLFGPAPRFRNTPIGIANHFLVHDVPRVVNAIDRDLTGHRLGNFCRHFFSERSPIVMVTYLFLMSGGIYIFFLSTWKHIPGPAVPSIHWWLVCLAIPTPYISLYFLSRSDPGIITPQNYLNHINEFPYDRILFTPDNKCRTCQFSKPARSKHCSVCNVCVARHDHHCVWIGNCVGYSNTYLFLIFLFVNSSILAYSTYLHYLIFSFQVAQIKLAQKRTIESLGPALHSVRLRSTLQLYWFVIVNADLGGALFLVSAMICIVTTVFMFYHLFLLSTGSTTSESFKWADVKDALKVGEITVLDQDDPLMVNRSSRIVPLDPPTNESEVETPAERACREELARDTSRGARKWSEIDNIYASESRWENLIDGIRGKKVLPAWERPKRRWMKRKD